MNNTDPSDIFLPIGMATRGKLTFRDLKNHAHDKLFSGPEKVWLCEELNDVHTILEP